MAVKQNLEPYWMPFTGNRYFKSHPMMMTGAAGMHYTTTDDKKILDGISGLWCCNAGHCHPKIVAAIQKQAAELDYATAFQIGPSASTWPPTSRASSASSSSTTCASRCAARSSRPPRSASSRSSSRIPGASCRAARSSISSIGLHARAGLIESDRRANLRPVRARAASGSRRPLEEKLRSLLDFMRWNERGLGGDFYHQAAHAPHPAAHAQTRGAERLVRPHVPAVPGAQHLPRQPRPARRSTSTSARARTERALQHRMEDPQRLAWNLSSGCASSACTYLGLVDLGYDASDRPVALRLTRASGRAWWGRTTRRGHLIATGRSRHRGPRKLDRHARLRGGPVPDR